ncbi:MAG TPA: hypothetical protein VFD02_02860 [Syntrophomonadaceae bacterium]|nr:hypothetical protein [Syntrophomonadaceae bacterium]
MSLPNISNHTLFPDINRDDLILLVLFSIALEKLGLAHIVNAEAEKIQYITGTLEREIPNMKPSVTDLLNINNAVGRILKGVIENQILLQFKLEEILDYLSLEIHVNTAMVTATYNGETYSDRDSAYYHTKEGG